MKVYLLKSFGVDESGGNPAGVVLDADSLTDVQKKYISKEVGFSETAFIEKSDKADYKVRFFTPKEEVDLCGHATIATYSFLFQKAFLKPGNYKQELKAGVLGIEVKANGLIVMEQTLPVFSEFIEAGQIKSIFDSEISVSGLKPQIVSTGLRDILLPVPNREQLFALKPNFNQMAVLNKETNSVGMHAFTLDTIDSSSVAHCRNFSPLYGIKEESATGSSNGALACYLFKYGKIKSGSLDTMKFEQGYSMNKPSEIFVTLHTKGKDIKQVLVEGKAILFGEKEVEVQL